MSRFLNSNTLSFATGVVVGSVSSYFYCKYSRNSPCTSSKQSKKENSSDDETTTESFVKQVGKIIRV